MLLQPLKNENGFILVLAMAMLVVLSIIGLSGTRTSVIDLKIAGNEREMTEEFSIADSLWQLGALWTNYQSGVPEIVNRTLQDGDDADNYENDTYYQIVRNFGDGEDGTTNESLPDDTQDGTISDRDFWYRVTRGNGHKVTGGDDTVKAFPVDIEIIVAGRTQVGVRVEKEWRVE